jgi:hypothetical protein
LFYSPFEAIGGLVSLACTFFWIFLLAVVVLFLIKVFSVNKYAEESVLERWSAVLPGQADKAASYLERIETGLRARSLPFNSRRERIPVSLTSSEAYDFVVCEMNADYSAFMSYVAVGSDLEVSWLIQDHMIRGIYRVPILGPLLLSVMKRYTFANGNKVRAFASATYSCAIGAAEQIMDETNSDKSRLNRNTSGKLGPL